MSIKQSLSQNIQSFRLCRRQAMFLMAAGLTGCANIHENQDANNSKNRIRSFTDYWGKMSFWNGAVPNPTYTSYPVPVLRDNKVQIAYMVGRHIYGTAKGYLIWPPYEIAWFDPIGGKMIDETFVTPDYFGQTDDSGDPFKQSLLVQSVSGRELDNLMNRLFVLYDELFSAWMNNPSAPDNDKLQDAAREFLKIFDQVTEPALKPYYSFLGQDYFGWLRSVAREPSQQTSPTTVKP